MGILYGLCDDVCFSAFPRALSSRTMLCSNSKRWCFWPSIQYLLLDGPSRTYVETLAEKPARLLVLL